MNLKTNKLILFFKATYAAGYPSLRILFNNKLLLECTLSSETFEYELPVGADKLNNLLIVERYNKLENNEGQILEITKITVDNIDVPEFLLLENSVFKFNDQVHNGSRYFVPNGTWSFTFDSPLLTYILDQKIIHESKYNQDYLYPWSYKLGPDSVEQISLNIERAICHVNKL